MQFVLAQSCHPYKGIITFIIYFMTAFSAGLYLVFNLGPTALTTGPYLNQSNYGVSHHADTVLVLSLAT